MRFVISMTVGADEDGKSLLDWLIYHLIDERRAGILRALKAGRVAIDRQPVSDPDMRVVAGTEIGFQEAGDDPDSAEPWTRRSAPGFAISGGGNPKSPLGRKKR